MASPPHFLIFPFMAKGHTIPLLHLAHLLLRRNVSVTVITTPSNSTFVRQSLTDDTGSTIVSIPFPQNIPQIPQGTESTDKLPSMSLHLPFARATQLMQPHFEETLRSLPRVDCLISDAFLFWSQTSASKFQIPVFFFYGINNFVMTVYRLLAIHRPHKNISSMDESFEVPMFPRVKLTKSDIEPPFVDPDPNHPELAFVIEQVVAASQSKGYIVNSFRELEPEFVDYWNREFGPRAWCVGPLCLAQPQKPPRGDSAKPRWIEWLDEKLKTGRPVLYAAFGSQAEISTEQYKEIAIGLGRSEVDYLWVVRSNEVEEVVSDKGLIVREWVDQVEILGHEGVGGFMSHCGWNSVMESLSASVPILAWPMMAEQHFNARLVVEELGVGIRVVGENGSVRGFVRSESISDGVRELILGQLGKQVRTRVEKVGASANKAVQEGGSSVNTLGVVIEEVCGRRSI